MTKYKRQNSAERIPLHSNEKKQGKSRNLKILLSDKLVIGIKVVQIHLYLHNLLGNNKKYKYDSVRWIETLKAYKYFSCN